MGVITHEPPTICPANCTQRHHDNHTYVHVSALRMSPLLCYTRGYTSFTEEPRRCGPGALYNFKERLVSRAIGAARNVSGVKSKSGTGSWNVSRDAVALCARHRGHWTPERWLTFAGSPGGALGFNCVTKLTGRGIARTRVSARQGIRIRGGGGTHRGRPCRYNRRARRTRTGRTRGRRRGTSAALPLGAGTLGKGKVLW